MLRLNVESPHTLCFWHCRCRLLGCPWSNPCLLAYSTNSPPCAARNCWEESLTPAPDTAFFPHLVLIAPSETEKEKGVYKDFSSYVANLCFLPRYPVWLFPRAQENNTELWFFKQCSHFQLFFLHCIVKVAVPWAQPWMNEVLPLELHVSLLCYLLESPSGKGVDLHYFLLCFSLSLVSYSVQY